MDGYVIHGSLVSDTFCVDFPTDSGLGTPIDEETISL